MPNDRSLVAVPDRYCHEAFVYRSEAEFLDQTLAFVRAGLAADELTFVVVESRKIEALRSALGAGAGSARFADIRQLASNPARILPAWLEFIAEHSGRALRGISEPMWSGRTPAEIVECQLHESLLNHAVPAATPLWLLCPYDGRALSEAVIDEARTIHPLVREGDTRGPSAVFRPERDAPAPWETPCPTPPKESATLDFSGTDDLSAVRAFVNANSQGWGFAPDKAAEIVVAVHEIVTNSLRHGGGSGTLRLWEDNGTFIGEVRDAGRIAEPMAGRIRPPVDAQSGRGLWIANQLCDLVQIRHDAEGNTVRLHVYADPSAA